MESACGDGKSWALIERVPVLTLMFSRLHLDFSAMLELMAYGEMK